MTRKALRHVIADPGSLSRRLLRPAAIASALRVLIGGSLGAWWSVRLADLEMKGGLLLETRLLAQSLNVERIAVLAGDLADLEKAEYQRLKNQLVQNAAAYAGTHGPAALLEALREPNGRFHRGDLYAFAYDRYTTYLTRNPAIRAWGWAPRAHAAGQGFLDFVHPHDQRATLAATRRLDAQDTILGFENRYRRRDGSYRWIEWRSFPSGELIYAAARDVTERKQAQAEPRNGWNRKAPLPRSPPVSRGPARTTSTPFSIGHSKDWASSSRSSGPICSVSRRTARG